jgi:alpha-1,2-mannosyltransferase
VFVGRPFVWLPYGHAREYGWSPLDHVVGNAYLLAALALSAWAAVALQRRDASSPGAPTRRVALRDRHGMTTPGHSQPADPGAS